LGIGTNVWRKANWRLFGLYLLAIPITVDLYCYALSGIENMVILEKDQLDQLFEATHRIRHFSIAIIFMLVAFWNSKDIYTDPEVLQDIIKKAGTTYSRTMSLRLARAAIFGKTNLRQRFMDFYKQKEAENDAVSRSEEYKELRSKVMQQNNLAEIIKGANTFSNDVMELAVSDGILSDYQRLPPQEFTS
jgi:hypothetical protein